MDASAIRNSRMDLLTPHPPHSAREVWRIFAACSAAIFFVWLDGTALPSMFSSIRQTLSVSDPASMSWVMNAYTVSFAATLVPGALFAERLGMKLVFRVGMVGFILSSLGCALATDVSQLIVCRVVQGVFAGCVSPSALALAIERMDAHQRTRALYLWAVVGGVAAASGPVVASVITKAYGWQWVFLINVPIGAASLIGTVGCGGKRVGFSPASLTKSSVIYIALFAMSIVALCWPISERATGLESHGLTRLSILIPIVVLIGFGAIRRSSAHFVNDGARGISASVVGTFSFGAAFSILLLGSQMIAGQAFGLSEPEISALTAISIAVSVAVSIGLSVLGLKRNKAMMSVVGCLICFTAGMFLAFAPESLTQFHLVTATVFGVIGFGMGLVFPNLMPLALSFISRDHAAIGSALNQAVRHGGTAVGFNLTLLVVTLPWNTHEWQRRTLFMLFASVCILSAIAFCFALDRNMNSKISAAAGRIKHLTRWTVMNAIVLVLRVLAAWRLSITIKGSERLRELGQQPAMVIANHSSHLDFFILTNVMKRQFGRKIAFVAKKELWDSFIWRQLMVYSNAIPLDRDHPTLGTLRQIRELAAKGYTIGIFPEGTRSSNGHIGPYKVGFARLAQQFFLPVVPVGLIGFDVVWPKGRSLKLTGGGDLEINIGFPFRVSSSADARQVAHTAMLRVSQLAQRKFDAEAPVMGEAAEVEC